MRKAKWEKHWDNDLLSKQNTRHRGWAQGIQDNQEMMRMSKGNT